MSILKLFFIYSLFVIVQSIPEGDQGPSAVEPSYMKTITSDPSFRSIGVIDAGTEITGNRLVGHLGIIMWQFNPTTLLIRMCECCCCRWNGRHWAPDQLIALHRHHQPRDRPQRLDCSRTRSDRRVCEQIGDRKRHVASGMFNVYSLSAIGFSRSFFK